MQIHKKDAEHRRHHCHAFHVEQDENEQYKDAGYFNSSALLHTVSDIEKEIDKITAHGQHNKSIELPEPGLGR